MSADMEKISRTVRSYQDEKRFAHTLAVVREAGYIAKKCAFSEEYVRKAELCAMLHDITKKFSEEKQRILLAEYAEEAPVSIATAHEKTGAHFARKIFGEIVDDEVFSAIHCHTTGKTNMSMLDMVLFIADFTEETRTYRSCAEVRAHLHSECEKLGGDKEKAQALLREVTLKIMAETLAFLAAKRKKIDLEMISAWNSMII